MSTISNFRASIAALALGTSLALAACGGARVYNVTGSQRDPGADARMQIETIDGGNHLITITARNMTPPERLGDGNTAFLVWVRLPNGQHTMASRLQYATDSREGRATLTSAQSRFTILVTAERDDTATAPSDVVVLTQAVEL